MCAAAVLMNVGHPGFAFEKPKDHQKDDYETFGSGEEILLGSL